MPGIEIRRDFLIVASRLAIYNNNKKFEEDVFAQFIGMSNDSHGRKSNTIDDRYLS